MYLIDANVLIDAKNRYYAFDFAKGFWLWLERLHRQGDACSIDAVKAELLVRDDELAKWATQHSDFFLSIDRETHKHFGPLIQWAFSQNYTQDALKEFADTNADFLLVAYAKEHDCQVVTLEKSNPQRVKRVMIPDACKAFGVPVIDTFDMMRRTGAQLVL